MEKDSSEDPMDGFQDPDIDMTTEAVDEIDVQNARHNQCSDCDCEFANKAMAFTSLEDTMCHNVAVLSQHSSFFGFQTKVQCFCLQNHLVI